MTDSEDIVRELKEIKAILIKNLEWDKKIQLALIIGAFSLIGIRLVLP